MMTVRHVSHRLFAIRGISEAQLKKFSYRWQRTWFLYKRHTVQLLPKRIRVPNQKCALRAKIYG